MKFALGQSIQRLEDDPLLRGAGRYTDDFALAKAAHVIFVRSPHAHARLEKISVEEARKAPGVLAILTGRDVKADGLGNIPCLIPVPGLKETPRPILALETVKHVGDPVAMVIAETLQQAKDAAEQVEIDYAPLRPVTEAKDGEVLFEVGLGESKAKVDAALAKAAHLTRLEAIGTAPSS